MHSASARGVVLSHGYFRLTYEIVTIFYESIPICALCLDGRSTCSKVNELFKLTCKTIPVIIEKKNLHTGICIELYCRYTALLACQSAALHCDFAHGCYGLMNIIECWSRIVITICLFFYIRGRKEEII